MSSRSYVFTSFKVDAHPFGQTFIDSKLPEKVKYISYQLEKCPDTARYHWQGYLELSEPMRMVTVKNLFFKNLNGEANPHLEKRRGTPEEARNYSRKDHTRATEMPGCGPYELGYWYQKHASGGRPSKEVAAKKKAFIHCLQEQGVRAAYQQDPESMFTHINNVSKFMALVNDLKAPDERILDVYVLVGPSGIGKTSAAARWFGIENVFSLNIYNDSMWFDGYTGQDVLLIDELRPGEKDQLPFRQLLKLCDRYKLSLPIKGSTTQANWTKVVITSNMRMDLNYPGENLDPLWRRVTHVNEYLTAAWDGTPPPRINPPGGKVVAQVLLFPAAAGVAAPLEPQPAAPPVHDEEMTIQPNGTAGEMGFPPTRPGPPGNAAGGPPDSGKKRVIDLTVDDEEDLPLGERKRTEVFDRFVRNGEQIAQGPDDYNGSDGEGELEAAIEAAEREARIRKLCLQRTIMLPTSETKTIVLDDADE